MIMRIGLRIKFLSIGFVLTTRLISRINYRNIDSVFPRRFEMVVTGKLVYFFVSSQTARTIHRSFLAPLS